MSGWPYPTSLPHYPASCVKAQKEWLTERVEDAPTFYRGDLPEKAALRLRMAWQKLKHRAGEGDEMWAFAIPASSWSRQRQMGYALVRDGEIVDSVVVTRD